MTIYTTPPIVQPPAMETASTARQAIWHLGRMLELVVYTSDKHDWRADDADPIDDGRHDRGAPLILQIRGTFQPNTQKRAKGVADAVEAVHTESTFIVHIDSHDPVNLQAIIDTPGASAVFPDGLRLVDPDDIEVAGVVNHPMAIAFRGARYKIKQPLALYAGGASAEAQGAIYRAECQLWRDRFNERDAKANAPTWGPA